MVSLFFTWWECQTVLKTNKIILWTYWWKGCLWLTFSRLFSEHCYEIEIDLKLVPEHYLIEHMTSRIIQVVHYILFFPKNFQYFATFPSRVPDCYLLHRKWPTKKSDFTLRSPDQMSRSPTCREWVAVNTKGRNTIFIKHPVRRNCYFR